MRRRRVLVCNGGDVGGTRHAAPRKRRMRRNESKARGRLIPRRALDIAGAAGEYLRQQPGNDQSGDSLSISCPRYGRSSDDATLALGPVAHGEFNNPARLATATKDGAKNVGGTRVARWESRCGRPLCAPQLTRRPVLVTGRDGCGGLDGRDTAPNRGVTARARSRGAAHPA